MIDLLKEQLEWEVKAKNKLHHKLIVVKNDLDSMISMTRNKLLTKYNLYDEIE